MSDDFTNTNLTTGVVNVGGSATGSIETGGDADWFAVSLTAGETYRLFLIGSQFGGTQPNTLANPNLRVLDASGNVLASDNDGWGFNSFLSFTAPATGVYYLKSSSAAHGTGTYQLSVKPYATIPELADYLVNGWYAYVASSGSSNATTPRQWESHSISVNISALLPAEQAIAMQVLDLYHQVADISFTFTTGAADITYTDTGSQLAETGSTVDGAYFTSATINISSDISDEVGVNTHMFQTYLHETGHALGLGHSGPYNGGSPIFGFDNLYGNDTLQTTVMTYFGWPSLTLADHVITPQMADIYAVQSIYGAATDTRLDDTTYGFHSTAGAFFDFASYSNMIAFTIYDSGGVDTLDASGYAFAQKIDLTPGSWSSIGGVANNIGIYLTTFIENAIGGSGADTLIGNSVDNILTGGGGADLLNGGDGADTASYASSSVGLQANLSSPGGNTGDAAGDAYTSIENLSGSGFADTLTGDGGANSLDGGAGNDHLFGGAGDDILAGRSGADALDGGAGMNTADYSASAGGVSINLTAATASGGDAAGDTLINIQNLVGSALADTLTGNAGANALSGNAGNDALTGGAGADALDGGAGTDVVNYSASSTGVNVNLQTGVGSGGDAQGDTLTFIESVTGSAFADALAGNDVGNVLLGGDGNDILSGGLGGDQLTGGNGDDMLIGGAGADVLAGGAGVDTADYSTSSAAVNVSLQTGAGAGGDAQGDNFGSIENVTGSTFDDVLTGRNGFANVLDGSDGNDLIAGGQGADTLIGGNGVDTLDYSNSFNGVDIRLFQNTAAGGDANGDTISGFENIIGSIKTDTLAGDDGVNVISGGSGNETITGRDGGDHLNGDAGNDTLLGGNGADVLVGGVGNDTLGGGGDNDTADYSASGAAINVSLQTGAGAGGDAQGDTLVSIENVIGSAFADIIAGKNNWDNVLDGGAGSDTLSGGTGNDTFVFHANDANGDTVLDFSHTGAGNHDTLEFDGYGLAVDGATFVQIDATHWQINSADGLIHDTLIIANAVVLTSGDYIFGGG